MNPSVGSFRFSRLAVNIIFFLNGFVHANLFSRLPRIQDQFQVSNGKIGFVLLASSIGAFIAMPFTGWFIIRYGSRRITLFAVFFYCILVPFVPLMTSLWLLMFVFFLMGISAGMLDIAMNSQAVMVEQQMNKPIMTSFHALFSIGMMLGAASGSFFSGLDTPLATHFAIITTASLIISFFARYYLIHDKPAIKTKNAPAFRLPNRAMVGIGIIAFCCMLGEGAMADWSTNYMENVAQSGKAMAPMGLAFFALAMTIGRVFGDSARLRFGDRNVMVACGTIATLGLMITLFLVSPYLVITGFFIVGLGLSTIVPIAYSLAGNTKDLPPGVGLAMVTTVGYSGFLFGPPIIGFIADAFTLRMALFLVLILFMLLTFLGSRYKVLH